MSLVECSQCGQWRVCGEDELSDMTGDELPKPSLLCGRKGEGSLDSRERTLGFIITLRRLEQRMKVLYQYIRNFFF